MFSYNSKGACPNCGGKGYIKTELAFMGDFHRHVKFVMANVINKKY